MTLTQQPARRWPFRGVSAGLVAVVGLLCAVLIVAIATADRRESPLASSTQGSGTAVTETRDVAPFAAVELAGTNALVIHVGPPTSLAVTADDNLVGRVTTVVRDGRLVVDDTGSFTTKAPMHVAVSTPTLDGIVLSGDGTVTVDGLAGADFTAEMLGTGTLAVSGSARRVTAVLEGDGALDLSHLAAVDGAAQLGGTGTIRINATGTLDATLTGTGTILYGGDPTVTVRITGTGVVVPG